MQSDCLEVNEKLGQSKEKYRRAALLMADMLNDLSTKRSNILHDSKMHFDELEALAREQKVEIAYELLS